MTAREARGNIAALCLNLQGMRRKPDCAGYERRRFGPFCASVGRVKEAGEISI